MEISFVIDPLSVVIGVVLNWVILFTVAAVFAVRNAAKKQKQNNKSASFDLDNWKL